MNREENFTWVSKTLEIIERGIEHKCDITEIKREIRDTIPYNYNYFGEIFKDYLGCTIAYYIRTTYLLRAYKIWEKEKTKLSQRDSYEGIDYFLLYFRRTFGFSIDEAENKGVKKMETITQEEMLGIKKILDESALVDDYEMKDGNISIRFDMDMIIIFVLSHKSYVISEELVKQSNWGSLSEESRKIILIVLNRAGEECNVQNKITISLEELENEYAALEGYNINAPLIFNGFYIYSFVLEDKLKPVFEHIINAIINNISVSYPNGPQTPKKYGDLVKACRECKGLITVNRLAEKSKKSEKEVINILWEMAQKGFLKIEDYIV